MERKHILQKALAHLNSHVAAHIDNNPAAGLSSHDSDSADGRQFTVSEQLSENTAVISINNGADKLLYQVFIQSWAPQKDITTLIAQLKALPGKPVLFADFVNPVMADKLRQRSIAFVDCAGNLSLKRDGFNFYVKGKKLSRLSGKRVRGRAFNSAGLKLIFAMFNQPQFLNASYRDISNKVNIALGSVGPVIDDLYASGYILDEGERKLVNKKRLYERWVDGYLEKLRPKQIMACYRLADSHMDKDWWQKADPAKFQGVWGGEVVVAKSTPFMVPEKFSLYFLSEAKHRDFANYYGLVEDDDGDICVYKAFWAPSYAGDENEDNLSPMIVYADIVDSINPGSWDVAKTFYGEAIAHLLKD